MAGKGDSDAKGGVNRRFGSGTGTWRVTGHEGLEGLHGELLAVESGDTAIETVGGAGSDGRQRTGDRAPEYGDDEDEREGASNSGVEELLRSGDKGDDAKRIGINMIRDMHFLEQGGQVVYDYRYGPFGSSFEDIGSHGLGATVARQLGGRDLFWRALVPFRGMRLVGDLETQVESEGPHADFGRSNVEALADQLSSAEQNGVKLIYTFLHMFTEVRSAPPPSSLAVGQLQVLRDGDAYFHKWRPPALGGRRCRKSDAHTGQRWERDHIDQREPGGEFPIVTSGRTSGLPSRTASLLYCDWHLRTLDLSSGYKRDYTVYAAEAVGNLLSSAFDRWRLMPGPTGSTYMSRNIDEVVEAIEVFNEVDHKSIYMTVLKEYDPELSAYFVGETYARVAHQLRGALDALPGGSNVRLMLPSISSYNERSEIVGRTWEDRKAFVKALVARAAEYLVVDIGVPVDRLPAYFQGIDYHYYHFSRFDNQHIAFLPLEIEDLRRAIWEGVKLGSPRAAEDVDVVNYFEYEFPISVMENGTSGAILNPAVFFPSFVLTAHQPGSLAPISQDPAWAA